MLLHTQDGVPVSPANPAPVSLYSPSGVQLFPSPRLAADGLAPPTAPDVLATLLAYDPTAAQLKLLRTTPAAGNSLPAGLPLAVTLMQYDSITGAHVQLKGLRGLGDNHAGDAWMPAASGLWNGAGVDKERGNLEGTLLASAARTTTTNTPDQTNYNARGVALQLNITAASGTGGLVLRVQWKDPASGAYSSVNAALPAWTVTGLMSYLLYPGASTGGSLDQATAQALPRTWRVQVVHGDASSYSYSLGYALIN